MSILPNEKKSNLGSSIIYLLYRCRHDGNCKFKINCKNVFLCEIKTHKYGIFAVETLDMKYI